MIWGCIGQFRYNTETEIPNPKYSIDDPIPPSAGGNIPQNTGKDNPEFLRKIPSPEVKRPRIPCRLAYTGIAYIFPKSLASVQPLLSLSKQRQSPFRKLKPKVPTG